MNPDELLDEMANAFNDAYDLDVSTETMLRAALRVLVEDVKTSPDPEKVAWHILQRIVEPIAMTEGER